MDKRYNVKEVEAKWADAWVRNKTYAFKEHKNKEKNYIIDTPPPYPYVSLHAGNFYNFAFQDFVARYKRLHGFSVLHPWGWDCHGLPAEIHIEKTYGKKAEKIGVEAFKALCKKHLLKNIENIRKNQAEVLGMSVDWDKQYATMTPDYKKMIQKSFLDMVKKKFVYRKEAPVSWCISCHTSIAEAQTDKVEREADFHYIKLPLKEKKKGFLTIATTRPELMPSCVAVFVNPKDKRYKEFVGELVEIPFFGQEVKILADDGADPEFGTGAAYHCTFGDKADWQWVVRHKLPIIKSLEEDGKFNDKGKFLKGLTVEKARKKIVSKLKKEGLLLKTEKLEQSVSVCERCKTPLEILVKKQWFFATTKLVKDIARAADRMKWYPPYSKTRLLDWNNAIEWDWVISRQRCWATPFPVWYCAKCGKNIYATEDELPVDPTKTSPRKPCKCRDKIIPDTDVMDTWMDSSVSAHYVSLWLEKERGDRFSDLRSQGEDIIKTWLFYTMARCLAYEKKLPFVDVLINGMVMGTDGKKMSKRADNIVLPESMFRKYSVDAYRQWVGRSLPGEDWPINPKELAYSQKFLTKLWNVARFCEPHLADGKPKLKNFADKWIINSYYQLIKKVTASMDKCEWGNALEALRNFLWHEFADYYLEMIKYRLYSDAKDSIEARKVLKTVLSGLLRMLSPIIPFVTEEIWSNLFSKESVHLQSWPESKKVDEKIMRQGEDLKLFVSAMRTWKTNNKLGLGKPLSRVVVYASKRNVNPFLKDLKGTIRIEDLRVEEKTSGIRLDERFGFKVEQI
jgi:valyl-tRNA synthetase